MTNNIYETIRNMKFNPQDPNNIHLFHGSTHLSYPSVPVKGFAEINSTAWNCSNEDNVYFYELKRFMKCECEEEFEYGRRLAISRANESGQIQEALLIHPQGYTYIYEIIVPKEFAQFIEDDDSCDNMTECGAVQVSKEYINILIETGELCIYVYRNPFAVKCSLMYITGLIDNPHFCGALDDYEIKIIKALKSSSCYIEELFYGEFDYLEFFGKPCEIGPCEC